MSQSASNKKIANRLVALSSAAVLAVYAAGYVRTQPAAERFAVEESGRRPAPNVPSSLSAPEVSESREAGSAAPIRTTAPEPLPMPAASPVPSAELPPPETQVAVELPTPPPVTAPVVSPLPEQKTEIAAAIAPPPVQAPAAVPASAPAAVPVPAPAPAPAPAPSAWKDGTYLGWGTSRHGDIQAQVKIVAGRIESATIARCLTRYSCNVIEHLPPQVAQRQSADVDTVSRATQSADAFYWAVTDALAKAK